MEVCGVIFKENGKTYYFNRNNLEVNVEDYVIVETEKGEQFGKIVFIEQRNTEKPQKNILKIATKDDYNKFLKSEAAAQKVIVEAKKIANKLNLNMQFIDASYTFDQSQLLINFIADERIDFRELVKQLAAKYKTRIELHQVGVRDKAKEVGGLGICGKCLCCKSFLNHLDTITINMAKNQNIALNPAKINGACGRLLCCLSYEDDVYSEYRQKLPIIGKDVKYEGKNYKVLSIDVLNQSYVIDYNGENKEIFVNEKRNQ